MQTIIGMLIHPPFCALNCMLLLADQIMSQLHAPQKKMSRPAVEDTQATRRQIVFSVSLY